jgi:hypothetical protein
MSSSAFLSFALPFAGFIVLGLVMLVRRWTVLRGGIAANGRILRWEEESDFDNRDLIHYYAVVGFTDRSGARHEVRMNPGSRRPPQKVGVPFAVRYDPDNPKRAHPAGTAAMLRPVFAMMVLGALGVVMMWFLVGG